MYSEACHVQSSYKNRTKCTKWLSITKTESISKLQFERPNFCSSFRAHGSQMARATSLQPGLCKIRGAKTTRSIPSANDHKSQGHSQYSPSSRWHCVSRHVECVLLWSVGTSPKSLIYYVGSLCQAFANSIWQEMTVNKQHLPIHQSSVFDLQYDSNIQYTMIIRRIIVSYCQTSADVCLAEDQGPCIDP